MLLIFFFFFCCFAFPFFLVAFRLYDPLMPQLEMCCRRHRSSLKIVVESGRGLSQLPDGRKRILLQKIVTTNRRRDFSARSWTSHARLRLRLSRRWSCSNASANHRLWSLAQHSRIGGCRWARGLLVMISRLRVRHTGRHRLEQVQFVAAALQPIEIVVQQAVHMVRRLHRVIHHRVVCLEECLYQVGASIHSMHVVVATISASNPVSGVRLAAIQGDRVVAIGQHSIVVITIVTSNSCATDVQAHVVVGLVIEQSISGWWGINILVW